MSVVLVTDGEQRAALAATRSLGRAGHDVYVCSARARSLAGASRYCRAQAAVPDPLRDADGFLRAIQRRAAAWDVDVLLPISEAALLAVLPCREALAGVRIPFPGYPQFLRICDKAAVTAVAQSIGIRVPAQRRLDAAAERATLAPESLRFPLVLKPARSVFEANGARAKSAVVHVADRESLCRALERFPEAAYPILLQERIVGPGIGLFLLLREGGVVAAFSHRRIREKPPSGGVSVYRESRPLDPALLERSHALLRELAWEGAAMVEYKVDARTDTPYLMEINGRLWGSLQLAIDAGVDFPALLVAIAMGERVPPVPSYRVGIRSRWWWGDVDHLLARMRRPNDASALPPDAPGRFRVALDFLSAFGPGSRNEVFRLADAGPALRETLDWLHGR